LVWSKNRNSTNNDNVILLWKSTFTPFLCFVCLRLLP